MMETRTPEATHFAYWFLALFAVTQIPLYWVQYPDIQDFPNHLARIHVLLHLSESETLQHYYTLRNLQFGTNLAMDVVVSVLARWMSLLLALKIFASLSMLLLTSGAVALGRAVTGRFSYLLLGVLLFAHNAMFQFGLLNYLFGLGMAFWLLFAWIFTRNRNNFYHWITFALGCVLVYLCHLSALGVYAVGVLGYELERIRTIDNLVNKSKLQALLFSLTQFIPVAILHVLASTSTGNYISSPVTNSWLQASLLWTIYKVVILGISPALCVSGYPLGQSVFGFPLIFAIYAGFRKRILTLVVPVRWMASMLAVCILLLPETGFGTGLVDVRIIPALGLVLWSGLKVRDRSKLMPNVVLSVIATVVLLISLETTREWILRDDEYRHVRSALQQIPEGSRIAAIMLNERPKPLSISPHTGAWSVIDRSAFLSSFYLWPFQPVRVAYREPYDSLAKLARQEGVLSPPAYKDIKNAYDYVLVFGGGEVERIEYAPKAKTIFNSPSFRLIRSKVTSNRTNQYKPY